MSQTIRTLSKLIKEISEIKVSEDSFLVFRGESEDYRETALFPSIYRNGFIKNEDKIYREMQRFNDHEFLSDRTTFDKLSRMQHHGAPTRLLDVSEDLLSAVYMAIENKDITSEKSKKNNAIIYVFEIKNKDIKYYDSDAVSVISNLAKIPLKYRDNDKSKQVIVRDINRNHRVKKFNKKRSAEFLRHEIREEKPQFESIINPKHITSVLYVRPKLTSDRIKSQKGSFLLFGLNPKDAEKSIEILNHTNLTGECQLQKPNINITHPINKCHIFELEFSKIKKIKKDLEKIGIIKPYIYSEMDKVADYLKNI